MTSENTARWIQRYGNFSKALSQLERAMALAELRTLSELEQQGVIQAFEFTHELAWNVLRDYLQYQGAVNLIGSRDTTREAFRRNLIEDGETWMEMIKSRNLTTHTYNEKIATNIFDLIIKRYCGCFIELRVLMQEKKNT